ncbi:tetratricopeptide repeat protein, partial [Pseudomonas sp.]|uniref:tetratricopeptide repeat protein n=1 Tax=Pseudomonas sp. TaxID=306 RepID=UPI00338D77F7
AMAALREAVRLEPDNAHYGFVLAVALHDTGHPDQAVAELQRRLAQQPANREVRLTLVQYYLEQGHSDQAARLQAELAAINPDDPALVAPARP